MMAILIHAEKSDSGVLLTDIAREMDAERICTFFREQGTAATITPLSHPGRYTIFLVSITMDRFAELSAGCNLFKAK
jgi:hypothetical protein